MNVKKTNKGRKKGEFPVFLFAILPFIVILLLAVVGLSIYKSKIQEKDSSSSAESLKNDQKIEKSVYSKDSMSIEEFKALVLTDIEKVAKKLTTAVAINGLSLKIDGKLYPSSPWILDSTGLGDMLSDESATMPFTRIETGVLNTAYKNFGLFWDGVEFELPESPLVVQSLVSYFPDVGPVCLSTACIWENPESKDYQTWVDRLTGFQEIVIDNLDASPDGNISSKEREIFLSHLDGNGNIRIRLSENTVVKVILTVKSTSMNYYSDFMLTEDKSLSSPSTLFSSLPEPIRTGEWYWREKNAMFNEFASGYDFDRNGFITVELNNWSFDSRLNSSFLYGKCRIWEGFLVDLSLWFDREKWDMVSKDVFGWFDFMDIGLTVTNDPIEKNGIQMKIDNVGDRLVTVHIRDVPVLEIAEAWASLRLFETVEEVKQHWLSIHNSQIKKATD